jgi:hypothetical protein
LQVAEVTCQLLDRSSHWVSQRAIIKMLNASIAMQLLLQCGAHTGVDTNNGILPAPNQAGVAYAKHSTTSFCVHQSPSMAVFTAIQLQTMHVSTTTG